MSIKSIVAKIFASIVVKHIAKWANDPVATQQKVFEKLIAKAKNTSFGRDHNFNEIGSHDSFVSSTTNVPSFVNSSLL